MANDYSFTVDCACCALTLMTVAGANRQAWKDDANQQGGHKCECPTCGCHYATEDDGDSSPSGGVQTKDVSQPRIDSLGATVSGPLGGGTTVRVNGHGFNLGTYGISVDPGGQFEQG